MKLWLVIGAWLSTACLLFGAEGGPGSVAISHLEEIRGTTRSVEDVLRQAKLSPFCAEGRREWIGRQLLQLRKRLREGEVELKVMEVREDEELAGVLVSVIPVGDPFSAEVLPVAMRKVEGGWVPTPVLGSFANANVGYEVSVRERVEVLEKWMGRQKVLRMRDLYQGAVKALEERMRGVVPEELLVSGSAKDVMRGFLDACERRDLAAVLVYLGATSDMADEASSPQGIVSRGLRGEDPMERWKLLTSPDVARVVSESREERSETIVSVLFYDTESVTGANLMKFSLSQESGRWRVDLPRVLREAYSERRPWRRPDASEHKLRRRFSEFFEEEYEKERFDGVQEMGERVEEVLRTGTLAEFFAMLSRNEEFAEGERLVSYAEASQLWNEFRERGRNATHGVLAGVLENGTAGVVVLHLVTTAELDRLELVPLLLVKEDSGWAIAPGVTSLANWETMPKRESEEQRDVMMQYVREKRGLENKAAENFLKEFAEVDSAVSGAVDAKEAARLVREFREFMREGNLPRAYECCALLDRSEGAWEGLKSLTYEYKGTQRTEEPDRELGSVAKGSWVGVSLQLDTGPGGVPDYPLYLVRATEDGPRIVIDAGLRLATNKGREILNGRIWKHLDDELGKGELGLVRELFEVHLERSEREYAEWQKSNKSSP